MVIDNTSLIRELLTFPPYKEDAQDDYFYVVQLLQREKDNPTKVFGNPNFRNNSNRSIQQYQIYSLEDFDLKVGNIIEAAELYQARVYINLNIKNSRDVFAEMMKNMAARFQTSNFRKLHRMYNEAVGETNCASGMQKRWLVDLDTKEETTVEQVKQAIVSLPGGGKDNCGEIYAKIPTKSGYHLITSSFDRKKFADGFTATFGADAEKIDIHKNNPTILWMRTDWKEGENE